jgi:CBS domain-containing protein
VLTPFSQLFDLVKDARNDALHQGAFARHLTGHAIELALILEDALKRSDEVPVICDFMVRHPACASLWHPVAFVRQQLLANSFSFLPVLSDGRWHFVSDRVIAVYLGASTGKERRRKLCDPLSEIKPELRLATCVTEMTSVEEALERLEDVPLLVCSDENPLQLLGIVTAFDLL